MTPNEFIQARLRVKPAFCDEDDESKITQVKKIFVPIISNGVLINVEKEVKKDTKVFIPYTTYSNDFMIKNGVKQLKDVPLSSFAVFDSIKQVINN